MQNLRSHDLHFGAAATTPEFGAFSDPCQNSVRVQSEQVLKQGNQTFAVGVQKAEVARAPEPLGQYMLEQ